MKRQTYLKEEEEERVTDKMGASAAKESKKEGETTSCKFAKLFYSSQITHHKVSFVFSLLPTSLGLVYQPLISMQTCIPRLD